MGMMLIEIAEEIVEPLSGGKARAARLAEPPLADESGGVTSFFEQLGYADVIRC
jgi:hypothetical protein